MDNSTDQSVPDAEREQPEAKVNYRTGKRSVSGWIRADLVQYAEEVAHAKGRSLQSVMQDALESFKDQEAAPAPAPNAGATQGGGSQASGGPRTRAQRRDFPHHDPEQGSGGGKVHDGAGVWARGGQPDGRAARVCH